MAAVRWVLSLVSLLLVVFVVMKLATTQLKSALPAAGAGAGESSSAPPAQRSAQAVADQMQQALAQGAAARASAADD